MKRIIIEFDENEIDPIMAEQAIKGFELPWVKEISIDYDTDFYPITSLHKDDIRNIYRGTANEALVERRLSTIDEDDMKELASKMADAWCDEDYWTDLKIIFEERFLKDE